MKYQYRRGGENLRGVPAEIAAKELERIRKQSGRLNTEDVVEEAKAARNPLHPIFEWDDSEAGKQYRLWQARQLIRNVTVVRSDGADPEPVFVHVVLKGQGNDEGTTEQYYQSTRIVVNSVSELQGALSQADIRLQSARKSLDDLVRLAKESKHIKLASSAASHVDKASRAVQRISAD